MTRQRYLTLTASGQKLADPTQISQGAASAGDILALDETGRLHESALPPGVGKQITSAVATATIAAGKFVQFYDNAGVFSIRLADNSNGRAADGFILEEAVAGATAQVYGLDSPNNGLTALAIGVRHFLGTAGGVIAAPLDPLDDANANKVHQYLGVAKSATELVTSDSPVILL